MQWAALIRRLLQLRGCDLLLPNTITMKPSTRKCSCLLVSGHCALGGRVPPQVGVERRQMAKWTRCFLRRSAGLVLTGHKGGIRMPMTVTAGTMTIRLQDIPEVGRGVQSHSVTIPPLAPRIHPSTHILPLRTTISTDQIVIEGTSSAICTQVEWSRSANNAVRFHSPIIPPLVAKVPTHLLEVSSIRLVKSLPTAPVAVAFLTSFLLSSAPHSPRRYITPSQSLSPLVVDRSLVALAVRQLVLPVQVETQFEDLVRGLRMGNPYARARAVVNLDDTRTDAAWRSGALVRMGLVQYAIGAGRR